MEVRDPFAEPVTALDGTHARNLTQSNNITALAAHVRHTGAPQAPHDHDTGPITGLYGLPWYGSSGLGDCASVSSGSGEPLSAPAQHRLIQRKDGTSETNRRHDDHFSHSASAAPWTAKGRSGGSYPRPSTVTTQYRQPSRRCLRAWSAPLKALQEEAPRLSVPHIAQAGRECERKRP